MVVLDGYKDVPEPLVGDSIFDPHYPFLTTVSHRFDLNVDHVQRVWISGDHVDKRLTVIGLARDISTMGELSEPRTRLRYRCCGDCVPPLPLGFVGLNHPTEKALYDFTATS